MHILVQYFQSLIIRIHVGMRVYNELIKVYISPKLIFVQAVLNTVAYQN